MEALHKEVASRDDAIAEKEKRILDLKRKTQVCLFVCVCGSVGVCVERGFSRWVQVGGLCLCF